MCRLPLRCQIKETKPLTAPQLTFPAWRSWTLPLVRGHIAVVWFLSMSGACLMEWIITSITALIICCRVCFACDVREPAHCLIIQSDGAAQLCLQPEPRTRDHCERGLLLQTDDPFRGQARKTINDSHFLSTPVLKMHQDFNLFFTRICFFLFLQSGGQSDADCSPGVLGHSSRAAHQWSSKLWSRCRPAPGSQDGECVGETDSNCWWQEKKNSDYLFS